MTIKLEIAIRKLQLAMNDTRIKPYVNTKANVISPLPVKPRACNSLYRNLSVILTTSSSFSRLFSLNSLANWFYTSRVASWCWCPTYKVSIFLLLVNKYLRNYFWNVTFSYDRVRLVFKIWKGKTPSNAIITHRLDFRNFQSTCYRNLWNSS